MDKELLLWQWSTTAQITSALLIAVFFIVLARSMRRIEMRTWVHAWLTNLAALGVTSIFWLARPESPFAFGVLRTSYLFTKTMFVVLLAFGAWAFIQHRVPSRMLHVAIGAAALYAMSGFFILTSLDLIGVAQSALSGLLLTITAVALVLKRTPGAGWLAAGFVIRGGLALIESAAYATRLVPNNLPAQSAESINLFLASHSSLDTAAEWVIALGCVLTLYRSIQRELTHANNDLVSAQEVLQGLVDSDPLTGLANRRALQGVLRTSAENGATILFFDLNDFKEINDSWGHQIGDECLRRFARVLEETFGPDDVVIRYAGDEFVVVTPGREPSEVLSHVDQIRERLAFERTNGPAIRFASGHARLPIRGDGDAALREADTAMYRDKAKKTRRLRSL